MAQRTKQIGIRVDPSQERDLTHAAAKLKANQSVILRMALEEYLDNHPDLRAAPLANNDTTQQHLPFPDSTQKTAQTRVLFDDDKRTAWLVHYFDHLDQPRDIPVDGESPAEAFVNAARMLRRSYKLSNAPELIFRVRFVRCVDLNSPAGMEHAWQNHAAAVATYERILSLSAAESADSRAAPLRAQGAEPSRAQEPASSPESSPEPTSPEPASREPEAEAVVAQADAEPASQPRRTRKPTPKETPRPRSGKARPGSPSPRTPGAKRRR